MIAPSPQTVPFHVADPFDRVGARCDDPRCSRSDGHPGPHRSVTGEGTTITTNTFWWNAT